MAEGLVFMSMTVEKTDVMVSTMRKAVAYPLTLLTMFLAMMVGFAVTAVPILAEMMPPEKWPLLGRMLYSVSMVITNYGVWIGQVRHDFADVPAQPGRAELHAALQRRAQRHARAHYGGQGNQQQGTGVIAVNAERQIAVQAHAHRASPTRQSD